VDSDGSIGIGKAWTGTEKVKKRKRIFPKKGNRFPRRKDSISPLPQYKNRKTKFPIAGM
jgi:hypothetical protein